MYQIKCTKEEQDWLCKIVKYSGRCFDIYDKVPCTYDSCDRCFRENIVWIIQNDR